MSNEFFMDTDAVQKMSNTFDNIGDVFEGISTALTAVIYTLRAAAFISLGATAAQAQLLERIKPTIDRLASKSKEISQDLTQSIQAYENGDAMGATKFY